MRRMESIAAWKPGVGIYDCHLQQHEQQQQQQQEPYSKQYVIQDLPAVIS